MPTKDYIFQSANFLICAFALLGYARDAAARNAGARRSTSAALAFLFLANIFFVVTSRTALLVAPVLLLVLGWREFGWKGLTVRRVAGRCRRRRGRGSVRPTCTSG